MSLDVYLEGRPEKHICRCVECGHEHERKVCPVLFHWDVTHNLTKMANAAGVYEVLWYPEKLRVRTAKQLYPRLERGLNRLLKSPGSFRKYNPANGWGSYEDLVSFVTNYKNACFQHPSARVRVSR